MSNRRLASLAVAAALVTVPVVGSAAASGVSTPFSAPAGATGPDDLTQLGADLWVGYQNGVGADGSPSPSGATDSTVAGFTQSGTPSGPVFSVPGKVDGLTADPVHNRLIATVNEDLNSALFILTPSDGTMVRYTYAPDPSRQTTPGSAKGGRAGGTDAISIVDGVIYLAHSNPAGASSTPPTFKEPTVYRVALNDSSRIANLQKVWTNDASATDATTGDPIQLQLTDPDSNFVMPDTSPRFVGQLAQVSQGDGVIVFAGGLSATPALTQLTLNDGSGSAPSVDGMAEATAPSGTLFFVDRPNDTIKSIHRTDPSGTVYVGEDNGSNNPLIGTLNLTTGSITPFPFATSGNPKGILFVP
jgi:hypothetical protein